MFIKPVGINPYQVASGWIGNEVTANDMALIRVNGNIGNAVGTMSLANWSGAPVYAADSKTVVGVHHGGDGGIRNAACKITASKYAWLLDVINTTQ